MATYVIFLNLSLALYALMHVYVYRRVTQAFPLPPRRRWLAFAIGGLLAASPFIGRALDRFGWVGWSRAVNLPAFFWMVWVFWFLAIGLVLDVWNGSARATGRVAPAALQAVVPPKARLALTLVLILAGTAWGLVEADRIRVREFTVTVTGWPSDQPPVRAVLVSDVHLSTFRGSDWSRRVTGLVAELKPDILFSAGDLTDAPYPDIAPQAPLWATLQPPLGKFAVLGNHDYYTGLQGAVTFHRDAGFELLRGAAVDAGDRLRVAGLDDPAGRHLGQPCQASPSLLAGMSRTPGRFTILLRHQPVLTALPPGVLDLQLSGHTHAGQVFPFQIFVRLLYRYMSGWYPMGEARLYVSPGTGTWGPPLRVSAPPEITVFVLAPEAGHP